MCTESAHKVLGGKDFDKTCFSFTGACWWYTSCTCVHKPCSRSHGHPGKTLEGMPNLGHIVFPRSNPTASLDKVFPCNHCTKADPKVWKTEVPESQTIPNQTQRIPSICINECGTMRMRASVKELRVCYRSVSPAYIGTSDCLRKLESQPKSQGPRHVPSQTDTLRP